MELLRKRSMEGDVDFLPEALRVLVEGITAAGYLAFRDPIAAQTLDQVIHPPSGHPFHVGLLDDTQQGFLAATPRFQQAGEVAPLPDLGDAQLHGAYPGVPGPAAITVAVGEPIRVALPVLGAETSGFIET